MVKRAHWFALYVGLMMTLVILTNGDSLARALTINRMRVRRSVPPDAESISITDCRLLLAVLQSDAPRLAEFVSKSPCLSEGTALSDLLRLRLGEWYQSEGDAAEARRIWQGSKRLNVYFLQRSAYLIDQGDVTGAQRALASVEGWSDCPSTELHLTALIALELPDQQAAIAAMRQALARNSYCAALSAQYHTASTAYELGRAAMDTQDWETARDAFALVVKLDPQSETAWMRLGLVYLSGFNDPHRAELAFRQSLAHGDIDWAHLGLGQALEAQGRDAEAMGEMLTAFRMNGSARFRDELLRLLSHTRDRGAALSLYSDLFSMSPLDPVIIAASASAAAEAGEYARASDLYQRALAIEEHAGWRQALEAISRQLPSK